MLAGYVASRASVKSAAFDVVTGVGRPIPLAGVLFFIGGLGLAGIPPTNGFISKMLVFKSGIEAQQLWALLLIGLASTLTLVYTMRAFRTEAEGSSTSHANMILDSVLAIVFQPQPPDICSCGRTSSRP